MAPLGPNDCPPLVMKDKIAQDNDIWEFSNYKVFVVSNYTGIGEISLKFEIKI